MMKSKRYWLEISNVCLVFKRNLKRLDCVAKLQKNKCLNGLRLRKVYIALTLFMYLSMIFYFSASFHFHFNLGIKQINNHDCVGHKFHPNVKFDFVCIFLSLNSNHIFSKIYNLDSTRKPQNTLFCEPSPHFKVPLQSSIQNRAPPVA